MSNKEHKCGKIPHWYVVDKNEFFGYWRVSEIFMWKDVRYIKYCPWCGVELDGEAGLR